MRHLIVHTLVISHHLVTKLQCEVSKLIQLQGSLSVQVNMHDLNVLHIKLHVKHIQIYIDQELHSSIDEKVRIILHNK